MNASRWPSGGLVLRPRPRRYRQPVLVQPAVFLPWPAVARLPTGAGIEQGALVKTWTNSPPGADFYQDAEVRLRKVEKHDGALFIRRRYNFAR